METRDKSMTNKRDALSELDHPCKETCSGWKQGYEKGLHARDEEVLALNKRIDELEIKLDKFSDNR
jgi:hypothetical protein